MSIYHNHPYVYLGVHRETGQFYIGFRASNKVPSYQDLGRKYHTSSKYVTELGFNNFTWTVLAEFFTETAIDDAYWFEQDLIRQNIENEHCLNRQYTDMASGKRKFSMAGCAHNAEYRANCSDRMLGRTMSDETKAKMANSHKGKKRTPEQCARQSITHTGRKLPKISDVHSDALMAGLHKFYSDPKKEQARKERAEKISLAKKGKKIKPLTVESIRKAAESRQKPVSCGGKFFPSRFEASMYLGITPATVSARVKSEKFIDYFFLPKRK